MTFSIIEQRLILELWHLEKIRKVTLGRWYFTHKDFSTNGIRFYRTMKCLESLGYVEEEKHPLHGKGWRLTLNGRDLATHLEHRKKLPIPDIKINHK